MSTEKNILIINDSGIYGSGGAENRIRSLIKELLDRHYFNSIHIMHSDRYEQPATPGVIFHPVIPEKKAVYKATRDIIEKHDIDIIQVHNLQELYPTAVLAAKLQLKPVIWFVHDFWALCGLRSFINPYFSKENPVCPGPSMRACIRCLGFKGYLRQKISTFLMNKVNACVVPGNFVKGILEKNNFLKNKIKIVRPWIRYEYDLNIELGMQRDSHTVLFVGSLMEYKGAWQIVKALPFVAKEFPDVKLKIVGPDQERNNDPRRNFDELANKEGVADKIQFLGYRTKEELSREYQKATVLAFPTDCLELFGQVWAEALFFECPVIASDTGGVSEYLRGHGILYPPKDYDKLAELIIDVLKNKEIYFEKAKKSRDYIMKNFTLKTAIYEIMNVYQGLRR